MNDTNTKTYKQFSLVFTHRGQSITMDYSTRAHAKRAMENLRTSGSFNTVAAWWIIQDNGELP